MSSERISLDLPSDLLAIIDEIAEITSQTRDGVVTLAIRNSLHGDGAYLIEVLKGQRQIAEGQFEMMNDVLMDVDAILSGKVA